MRENVKLTDKLTVSVVKECDQCTTAPDDIVVGAHVRAPSTPTGEYVKGELASIETYKESWKTAGVLLVQPDPTSPFGCTRAVSLVGPIDILCKHCGKVVNTVTKWT